MYNFNFNFNFIPLETEFIEKHMPAANGEYVKIYLYILNTAIKGNAVDAKEVAKALSILESDVVNAIEYWMEKGVLSAGEAVKVAENHDPARNKKTLAQINENPLAAKELAELSILAEDMLQKPITDADRSTLYWLHDELGFSSELTMMLLEYCVSKEKRDMRYIEKVAIAWHEKGITDIASAEKYMSGEKQRNKAYYELRKLFGIVDRNLSKTEECYLEKWCEDCGMSTEMIALAYEYCIMATQKLSFQYMDKIIENWKKAGISTIEAAERDHEDFKNRGVKKFGETSTSVYTEDDTDYAEIERLMNEKY